MWFRVDDKLWGSPKWLALKPGARALWVTAGAWSMDQLTDGFVPVHVVRVLGSRPRDAEELVSCGMWEKSGDGFTFHDWHDWQPTRESVINKREQEAARKAEWRAKRAGQRANEDKSPAGVPDMSLWDNDVSPAGVPDMSRSSRPDPTRPDPTAPKGATSSAARKRAAHALPSGWEPNEGHILRAKELGVNLSRAVETFRNHALANDRRQVDWDRAFYNWLLKETPTVVPLRPAAGGLTNRQRNPWMYQ